MTMLLLLLLLIGGVKSSVTIYKLNGDSIQMPKGPDLTIPEIQKECRKKFVWSTLLPVSLVHSNSIVSKEDELQKILLEENPQLNAVVYFPQFPEKSHTRTIRENQICFYRLFYLDGTFDQVFYYRFRDGSIRHKSFYSDSLIHGFFYKADEGYPFGKFGFIKFAFEKVDDVKYEFKPSEIYLKKEFFDENGQTKEDYIYMKNGSVHCLKKGSSIDEVAQAVKNTYLRVPNFDNFPLREYMKNKDNSFVIDYSEIQSDEDPDSSPTCGNCGRNSTSS